MTFFAKNAKPKLSISVLTDNTWTTYGKTFLQKRTFKITVGNDDYVHMDGAR